MDKKQRRKLKAAGGGKGPAGSPADAPPGSGARGTVVGISAGACRVQLISEVTAPGEPAETIAATLPSKLARRQQSDLAVGDEVLVERLGDDYRVSAVLPRRSLLSRADPQVRQRRRAIAANVDLVVIVVAAQDPPLRPRLIDRCLVAVEHSGARPVLVVNKMDLLGDDERRREALAILEPYRALALPVLPCSVSTGTGIDAVRAALEGQTCVFVGQSGVGKSSLLNALSSTASAAIGAVRSSDGRGRHTTTASAFYELGHGIRVIDTPGIRQFGLIEAGPVAIAAGFSEFAPYESRCRYRDCTHTHEPGCAVQGAVADGAISRSRYASYLRLIGGDEIDSRPGGRGGRGDGGEET